MEKKKTGRGAFSMRGKGVKHGISGAFRTPSYFMTNKEKNELNGEVETFNMYETIIPIEEFKLKDKEMQKTLLTRWREIYSNAKITNEMKITNKIFYDLVADLDIPKKPRIYPENRKGRAKTTKPKQAKKKEIPNKTLLDFMEEEKSSELQKIEKIETSPVLTSQGITFNWDRIGDVETLNRILTKAQLNMDGENSKFRLTISLTQIIDE